MVITLELYTLRYPKQSSGEEFNVLWDDTLFLTLLLRYFDTDRYHR